MKKIFFIKEISIKLIYTIYDGIKVLKRLKNINRKKELKNKIFIICNGPSINNFIENSRELLENEDCIVVNFMATSKYYEIIKPKFYILADPDFWINKEDKNKDFDKIVIMRNNLFDTIVNKTKWLMTIYLPIEAKDYIESLRLSQLNNNIRIKYIYGSFRGFDRLANLLRKYNLAGFNYQNVSIAAIYTAIINRYKNLYLLGIEHDWIKNININDDNQVIFNDIHFYDNSKPVKRYLNIGLCEEYRAQYILFKEYLKINEFAKYMGSRIYNSTRNSMVDIFERKYLD